MRRATALMMTILLVLGMAACSKTEAPSLADKLHDLPTEQENKTPPTKQETPQKTEQKPETEENGKGQKPERPEPTEQLHALEGTYRKTEKGSLDEETYVEVRVFPDFVVLEYFDVYEGSTFSFWTEEFWPDHDCTIGTDTVLTGKSQEFSIMSKGNEYFEMPRNRTITMTEDGLVLQYEGEDEEILVLDDSDFTGHTPQTELQGILDEHFNVQMHEDLIGYWSCWDGWFDCWLALEDDGGFCLISKEPGSPIHLLDGVWGVDNETNDLILFGEMAGEGSYPYTQTWTWEKDDGQLVLTEEYQFLLPEHVDGVYFWEAEPEFYCSTAMEDAIGYVYPYYDLSGQYTDSDGTQYLYNYRVPQLLEDEGDAGEINAEIMEIYVPIVEDMLARMEQGEFLDTELVTWDQYVTEGILTIHIYSYSFTWETHHIWYYDLEAEKRVDSEELLLRIGISPDELLEKVRVQAELYFVDMYKGIPAAERKQYGYDIMYEWTISDEAINLNLPIFMDRLGSLCVYARIGSLAGPTEIWTPLYPLEEWGSTGIAG